MSDQSIVDKTMRSVFVGNIPYEVSEEKLKDIFSEVGPVLSFKLVFDRDSGKPKGYGFCEYKDQETALSAMRNLNNYEIAGRNLRVDNACTEKSRLEMQSLMQSAQVESTYGAVISPDNAPEHIGKIVASLPPEQMYELLKEMKQCIQNDPAEARTLLLQNPQLTFAFLQVMIAMKVVDPTTALSLLHAPNNLSSLIPNAGGPNNVGNNIGAGPFGNSEGATWNNAKSTPSNSVPASMQPPPMPPMVGSQDMDMRGSNMGRFSDQDLRIPSMPQFPQVDMFKRDPRLQQMPDAVPQFQGLIPPPPGMIPPNIPLPLPMNLPPAMGGGAMPVLPNLPRMVPPPNLRTSQPATVTNTSATPSVANIAGLKTSNLAPSGSDNEKANLIMQVLQLTDEQIAALPTEHRQSILTLKEQIAKSAAKR